MKVMLDTGSGYLYLPNDQCRRPECKGRTLYSAGRSSTSKAINFPKTIAYGSGTVSGNFHKDVVTVGGLKVPGAVFVSCNVLSQVPAGHYDGLMGLTPPGMTMGPNVNPKYNPFFLQMVKAGVVKKKVFSIGIARDRATDTSDGGVFILGGSDPKYFEGSLEYVPLTSTTEWQFEMGGIQAGSGQKFCAGCKGMVDSGSSILIFPPAYYSQIQYAMTSAGAENAGMLMTVDCSKVDKLPAINVYVGSKAYPIHPKYYVDGLGGDECYLLMVQMQTPGNEVVLGDPFMAQYYVEFDIEKKRMGFAPSLVAKAKK